MTASRVLALGFLLALLMGAGFVSAQGPGLAPPALQERKPLLPYSSPGGFASLLKTVPTAGAIGVSLDRTTSLFFTRRLDPASVLGAISVRAAPIAFPEVSYDLTAFVRLVGSRRVIAVTYPEFLPADSEIRLTINGQALRDAKGFPVDVDGDGVAGGFKTITFTTGVGAGLPVSSGTAIIVGSVKDSAGAPLQGAVIEGFYYPKLETDPPLAVPRVLSDPNGQFQYETTPFSGTEQFLIRVGKAGHSEVLRVVTVEAGKCSAFGDSSLLVLSPSTMVTVSSGAALSDTNDQGDIVDVSIPSGALLADANISVTILDSSDFLREELPQFVAGAGTFANVEGVFMDKTASAVAMRYPNIYNLPIGTRVPFGKVDHNTLLWNDLRDLYEGPPPVPDEYLGKVISDGMGGTVIEVQFDHFCSVCTGYCLNIKPPITTFFDNLLSTNPNSSLSNSCGNSVINLKEGFLWETLELLTVREFGQPVGISLGYFSGAANPTATLQHEIDPGSTRPIERVEFEFSIAGLVKTAAYGFSDNGQHHISTFIWDGIDALGVEQPTGTYRYEIVATTFNADSAGSANELKVALADSFGLPPNPSLVTTVTYPGIVPLESDKAEGRATIVNLKDSPYGAGWSILNDQRIHVDSNGDALLVYGNGQWSRFVWTITSYLPIGCNPNFAGTVGAIANPAPPQCTPKYGFIGAASDPSTLSRNPQTGAWSRSFPDGSRDEFDENGFLLTQSDRFGNTTVYSRTNDQLTSVETPTGYVFSLQYDGAGKLMRVFDSTGRSVDLLVDANGDLVQFTDAVGDDRYFAYNANHLLTSQTGGRGEQSTYFYENGRVVEASAYDVPMPAGTGQVLRTRAFEPSVLNGEVGSALADLQGTAANPISVVDKRIDRMIDGRGVVSIHEANERGETILVVDGLGRRTLFEYDSNGFLSRRIRADGSATEYETRSNGFVTQVDEYFTNASGNPTQLYSTERSTPLAGGSIFPQVYVDGEGNETHFTYVNSTSLNGLLSSIIDDAGNVTLFEYSDGSHPQLVTKVTYPASEYVTYEYDVHGNLSARTDYPEPLLNPAGRRQQFASDAAGNLATVLNANNGLLQFFYDGRNRLTESVDEDNESTLFEYEEACACGSSEEPTKITFPGSNGSHLIWVYDGLGRPVEMTDQLGNKVFYSYDAESNPIQTTDRNGEVVDYGYDAGGQLNLRTLEGGFTTVYGYDLLGNLALTSNSESILGNEYDSLGRLTSTQTSINLPDRGPFSYELSYAYDRVGNRLTISDNLGWVDQEYVYNSVNRLESLSVKTEPVETFDFAYDASGLRQTRTAQSTGVVTTYGFDSAQQLTSLVCSTLPALSLSYPTYDAVGNVTSSTVQVGGASIAQTYDYDAQSRLEGSTLSQSFGDSLVNVSSTYDAANRLTLDTEYSYEYDLEGRLTRRTDLVNGDILRLVYDAYDQLILLTESIVVASAEEQVLQVGYFYDGLGRRIRKSVNGVDSNYIYDGDSLILELDGSGRPKVRYSHGLGVDEPLMAFWFHDGSNYYIHADKLDSVRGLSDASGDIIQAYNYGPFGELLDEAIEPISLAFGFAGRERDRDSGLMNYRARYYLPINGRFATEDPQGREFGSHLYSYVDNNPTNYIDPSGEVRLRPDVGGEDRVFSPGVPGYDVQVVRARTGNRQRPLIYYRQKKLGEFDSSLLQKIKDVLSSGVRNDAPPCPGLRKYRDRSIALGIRG